MKIVCNTQALSESCQNVQRVVSSKTSIPAMEGILLKAENGKLLLTGYDLEVGIKTELDVKVEEAGSIIIGAKILCDILRKLPAENVRIEADERQLCTIKCGEAEYKIVGIDAAEYPELPAISTENSVIVDSDVLGNMVKQTIFAVSTADNNIIHTGIKFEISENKLRLIAVDGFRLAIRTENIKYEGDDISFVVPSKTLSEVIKLLDGGDVVSLSVAKRHIIFEVGSYCVISRLLDGEFLDYNAAVPKTHSTEVVVNTKTFIESIDRTSLLITDRLKSPLRCVFDENVIKISATTSIGTANDKINASVDGNRVEIGFNNRFLIDAFKATDVEVVKVHLNGSLSPITIEPMEGEQFLFLVLPVRLKNNG
ncbi:MAG: DNA polymerase III subunit beta [Clostridia bacterium]|nr:DNA polymerase III subunit beta [Clostridia bacterium]